MNEEECEDLNVSSNTFAEPMMKQASDSSIKHMYIQEQNVYGRFIPFLLLKDQLPLQIDSSGNSALSHMCSHNSPYLPLYLSTLKKYDPILNRPNKTGHTPLDIAAVFCHKQYVQLLKDKGAVDEGKVNNWAIQGGNFSNWQGKVDPQKKELVHWAAYNDMPEVIKKYAQCGADLSFKDINGYTPIDLAILNKSYQSIRVLAQQKCQPQLNLLQNTDSKSIHRIFQEQKEPYFQLCSYQIVQSCFIPIIQILCQLLYVQIFTIIFIFIITLFWIFLSFQKSSNNQSFNRKIGLRSNLLFKNILIRQVYQILYLLMMHLIVGVNIYVLYKSEIQFWFQAVIFWIILVVTIIFSLNILTIIYGILSNRTIPELFQAHNCPYLYTKLEYIQKRNIIVRRYNNPYDKGIWNNIVDYFT